MSPFVSKRGTCFLSCDAQIHWTIGIGEVYAIYMFLGALVLLADPLERADLPHGLSYAP